MTLDEYVAWFSGAGGTRAGEAAGALPEAGLRLAAAVGEVAGVLAEWRPDREGWRDRLADGLDGVAHRWAVLCALAGARPSTLLAASRAHIEWRRAGRPPGGPGPAAEEGLDLAAYTAWVTETDGGGASRPDEGAVWEAGLALVGDAGEVVECLRRLAWGGEAQWERLAGELGDVWRHWTRLGLASGVGPAAILARSRARLAGLSKTG